MEVSVMRHLPNPFSYDARSHYQPWENHKSYSPKSKDQPSYPFSFQALHSNAQYPPSPPMERQSHTSLPPISTLLGNLRNSHNENNRLKRDSRHLDARIDPRLNGPPTPPSGNQAFEPKSAPLRQPVSAAAPPQPSPAYPTPHESRQGSASSLSGRPSLHKHRLSSSSWSTNSGRAPSPQSAPPTSITSATQLYPPASLIQQRSVPEYSPRTPRSPPSAVPRANEHERHWQPMPQAQHPQFTPTGPPSYMAQNSSSTQTMHLPPAPAPLSAQTPTTHPDRYVCPQCAKAFSRPSSLRIHVHSHTGEKPFVCPHAGCGKAFSVRSNMKRHQRGCHVDGANGKDIGDDLDMDDR